jgi:high-affinity Fe2+/Pb2+ permease
MADFVGKIIGISIGLSVAVTCLINVIAPAIVDAQGDDNLSTYAAIIGIILLVFVAGLVMYVWRELSARGPK